MALPQCIIRYLLEYGCFAAIIVVFFYDVCKVSKRRFIANTALCLIVITAMRVACEMAYDAISMRTAREIANTYYFVFLILFIAACVAITTTALKRFIKPVPWTMIFYVLAVTLETACFITVNVLFDLEVMSDNDFRGMLMYCARLILFSIVFCIVIRKFISPLFRRYHDKKTWLMLSISPLIGAVGYYVIFDTQTNEYLNFTVNTFIGQWIVYAALMAANALGAASVKRSIEAAEDKEKLDAANKMLTLQKEQYVSMAQQIENTRRLRHDFHHQAAAMSEMLKAGDVVILEEYLSQYAKEIPHAIVSTGNASADASFGYYISLAEKENIKVDHQIIMPAESRIEDTDLAVLIGNCMENAIEASRFIPEDKRMIKVRSKISGDFLMIVFENRFDGMIVMQDGKIMSRKRSIKAAGNMAEEISSTEGVGLGSVHRIVDDYGGEMQVTHEGGMFSVKVSIRYREKET